MITLTRGIGDSWLGLTNKLSGGDVIISSFYVRPADTTYGTGDGSSYENAWSGFSAIEWGQLGSHTRLYICGTHNEFLDWQVADTIINGNYPGDPGVIDGQNILNQCFRLVGYNNVTINYISFLNGVIDCAYTNATGVVYNYCTGSGSGNQAFQNEGENYHVTYNNCVATDNVDDGISLHGGGTVIANDCIFTGNGQGVHSIGTATFIGNRLVFENNSERAFESWADSNMTISNSIVLSGAGFNSSSSIMLQITNCVFNGSACTVSSTGSVYVTDSSFLNNCTISSSGQIEILRCFIEANVTRTLRATGNGNLLVNYCVIKIVASSNIYVIGLDSFGDVIINNCTFISTNSFGRGATGARVGNFTNCIFNGLNLAFNPNGAEAIINSNYCNFYNCNNISVPANGGIYNEYNTITGDPLFADIENDNYSLLEGSPCINAGFDTGFPEGIDTANWGDSENTPVVSTKLQGENYDIGAYVK